MNKDKDVIRCGVIVTNKVKFLACKPYGFDNYDIPKGHAELGETLRLTATRELREETSLVVNPIDLTFLGCYNYKGGYLYIFIYYMSELPNIKDYHCTAYFKDRETGKDHPEMKGYEYVSKGSIGKFYTPLRPIIRDIIPNLIKSGSLENLKENYYIKKDQVEFSKKILLEAKDKIEDFIKVPLKINVGDIQNKLYLVYLYGEDDQHVYAVNYDINNFKITLDINKLDYFFKAAYCKATCDVSDTTKWTYEAYVNMAKLSDLKDVSKTKFSLALKETHTFNNIKDVLNKLDQWTIDLGFEYTLK